MTNKFSARTPKSENVLFNNAFQFCSKTGTTFRFDGNKGVFCKLSDQQEIWLSGPIRVTALGTYQDSNEAGRLLELTDRRKRVHKIFVRDREFASLKPLVERLLTAGLELLSTEVRGTNTPNNHLIDYLYSYPTATLPIVDFIVNEGWTSSAYSAFNLAGCLITKPNVKADAICVMKDNADEDMSRAGTLQDWQKICLYACHAPALAIGLSHRLASVLVAVLDCENTVFVYGGETSRGKSSILYALESVFADPHTLDTAQRTKNSFIYYAENARDKGMVVDELKDASVSELVELIYALGNGVGKGRCDKTGVALPQKHFTKCRCASSTKVCLRER